MSVRRDLVAGATAIAPLLLGVVPFGLVAGVTAVAAGFSPVQAVSMSVAMFAGASQLAAIELVNRDAPVVVVVLTAVVINLRYLMYSASIAPYFRELSAVRKVVAGYLMTDQAYVVSVTEYRESARDAGSRFWYFVGGGLSLWVTWVVGTAVGAGVGATIPSGLSLEFGIPLTFMALLFPAIKGRATELTAAVAGSVAVLAAWLPVNLGLPVAAALGMAAGVAFETVRGDFPTVESVDVGVKESGGGEESGGREESGGGKHVNADEGVDR